MLLGRLSPFPKSRKVRMMLIKVASLVWAGAVEHIVLSDVNVGYNGAGGNEIPSTTIVANRSKPC